MADAVRSSTDVTKEVEGAVSAPRPTQTLDFMTWNVRGSRLAHIMPDLPARPKFIGFQEISCPAEAQWTSKGGYFTV